MKRLQTKVHADTMSDSKVIWSKKCQNLSLGQNLSLRQLFLRNSCFPLINIYWSYYNWYWYAFLQFWNNNWFVATFDV